MHGRHANVGMALDFFDAELEVGRAVALNAHLLIVLLADLACFSHVDLLG